MTFLRIHTLGAVAVEDGSFRQHQPIVLLAYLAHEGAKDRQHLASVFWPEAKKPLNNLSSALSRIRRLLPGVLEVADGRVGTTATTDALRVLEAVEDRRLDDAIAGYTGRFLDGYKLKSVGIELEEWIFQTRESIAGAVSLRAVQRSRQHAEAGEIGLAADLAETALTISFDGYPLTEHLGYLHGVLSKASRSAALRVRSEASAMGVELELPADLDAASGPSPVASVAAVDLAESAALGNSGIVGRSAELDELAGLVETNRLVTVFGFGGIGKTTLVSAYLAGRENSGMLAAVRVDLASNDDVDHIASLIGSGFGVDDSGSLPEQLSNVLTDPTLLYLDDVLPTAEVCTLIESLLASVDELSIITTSRPRFVDGDRGEMRLLGLNTDVGAVHSDAAELFAAKATATLARADLDAEAWERIEEICRSVAGFPLAIELIAAWLRLVPLREISKLLREGVLLDQRPPGATTTLEQIIRQSSALLRPGLQVALAEISVLKGSFDWLAARSIADVGVSALAELHDHSMITQRDRGRMECHPLVTAYAAEQLAERPAREVELRNNHSRYFLRRLADAVEELKGPEQGDSLTSLAADHDNIVAAWNHAVDQHRWEQLEALIEPLDTYLLRSGQLVIARRLYESAAGRLGEIDGGWQDLRANLANNLAWVHMLLGDAVTATRMCHDTIEHDDDLQISTRVALLRTKAALLSNGGRFAQVLAVYNEAIGLVDENNDRRLWALLREDLGRAHLLLGEIDKARMSFRSTLDAAREFMDPHMEARSYLMLGKLEIDREPARALVLFDEGELIASQHGLLHLQSYFCQEQGRAYLRRADHASAERAFERGLELADETGDLYVRAANELGLARTQQAGGSADVAVVHFEATLRLAQRIGGWSLVLGAAIEVARATLAGDSDDNGPDGDAAQMAVELLAFATNHPTVFPYDRDRGVAALGDRVPKSPLPADLRLDETCERVFLLLRYPAALAVTG